MANRRTELIPFRAAGIGDVGFISGCVERFYERDGGLYRIPYDHKSCVASIYDTIFRGVCVVGPKSCAGALIVPWAFNNRFTMATVFFWCFDDTREIHVLDFLRETCRDRGATHWNVASLEPKHSGRQFYAKRGLKLVEHQYFGPIKDLHASR